MNIKMKRSTNAYPEILYQKEEVEFNSIKQYMINFTSSGDWIIPLTGDYNSFEAGYSMEPYLYTSDDECINTYEPSLLRIYRRQDNEVVLKNTRKIAGKDASMHGLMGKLFKATEKLNKLINLIPVNIARMVAKKLQELYDSVMIDETSGHIVKITIWIPLWNPFAETAVVITLFKRINVVFT